MVLAMFFTVGIVSLSTAVAASAFSYIHLIRDIDAKLRRLADDLRNEYCEYGGISAEYINCIEDDAAEHDSRRLFILVADPQGEIAYATDMPGGFKRRLARMVATGRFNGRFYTERLDERGKEHGAVRYVCAVTHDGSVVAVAEDVTALERFLIILASTLGASALLTTLFSCLSAFCFGDRILKLNRLVEAKDRAYAELRRLTDDIAHDLRTPLTRLSVAAENEASKTAAAAPLAQSVMDETSAMLELIETMLAISQLEARIERSPRETLDLSAFVARMGELYAPVAEDAKLSLSVAVPSGPTIFAGHKAKLQQLLANLIENAVKFTPAGGKISVTLAHDGKAATLTVTDSGCGIATNDLPFIYTRFWRADGSRHLPGNGLGLALVKAIVTSYGGTIECKSQIGHGTEFAVRLPL